MSSSILIGCLSAAIGFAFRPTFQCFAPAPHRAATITLKLNKQQELARMLEQAKQQRDGIILDVPPEPPKAKAKPQGPGKVPKTREQLFAEMQKLKELAGGDQITAAKSGAMRFGGKKATPESVGRTSQAMPSAAQLREQAAASAAAAAEREAAARRRTDAAYSYDELGSLMQGSGKSGRVARALSDEKLPRGTPLPVPARLGALDGVPNSYASLEALADARRTLVLIASMDTFMSDGLRATLEAFAGTVDARSLGASIAEDAPAPSTSLSCPQVRGC